MPVAVAVATAGGRQVGLGDVVALDGGDAVRVTAG